MPELAASVGAPLDGGTQSFFESRFGVDFSSVRVHTDADASRSAADLHAHAFTLGSDIYFASGNYAPSTTGGRHLLAHELTHVVQQQGRSASAAPPEGVGDLQVRERSPQQAVVRRSRLGDAAAWVRDQVLSPEAQAFMSDLFASITEVPSHAVEILGEVWESIQAHWVAFTAVFLGFLGAEALVGTLTAAPEPTFLTKVLAFVLQALILVAIGVFAAVEVGQVLTHAITWWRQVGEAHGDRARISEASRSFCRVLLHIALLVLTVIGARARVGAARASWRGLTPEGPIPPPPAAGGRPPLRVIEGGGGGRAPRSATSRGGAPSAFDGSAARSLQPEPVEVPATAPPLVEVEPAPPTPAPTAAASPTVGPVARGAPAVAAATSSTQRSSSEKVADSNIFMDRVEGGPLQRARIDTGYLANPDLALHVPAAAIAEATRVDPLGTQRARLAGAPGGARIVPDLDGNVEAHRANFPRILSGSFGDADFRIALRAKERGVPLLTAQARMAQQLVDPNFPERVRILQGTQVELA